MNLILKEEIEDFRDVCNFLNWIPGINHGGCGIAALSQYRWLKQNRREEPPIILFYSNEKRYLSNLKYLKKGKKRHLKVPNHCVIGYPFEDFNKILQRWSYEFSWNQITNEKGILNLLNEGENWGHHFDRKYIPEIGEKLNIDLSDICLK